MTNGPKNAGRVTEARFAVFESEVRSDIKGVKEDIGLIRSDLQGFFRNRPRVTQWIPAVAMIGAVFWLFIQLYFGNANQTLREALTTISVNDKSQTDQISRLIELSALHTQQNAQSLQDRTDQRASLGKLIDTVTKLSESAASEHSERVANEREIETQFDADSQLRNTQWAAIMRKENEFQNALHDLGAKIPAVSEGPYFFPNISNRSRQPQGTP